MKKSIVLLIVLVIVMSLVNCRTASAVEQTAKDQLNETELLLFEALIKISKESFYEPSAVRVLDIEYYDDPTDVFPNRPKTVIIRLQGENRVGGTLNHYYKICIVASGELSESEQEAYEAGIGLYKYTGDTQFYDAAMTYKADFADWIELDEEYVEKHYHKYAYKDYQKEEAKNNFNIGRINRALKEYWEDLGF